MVVRVDRRRAQARREILDAAWALAQEHGLDGLSLRDLADAVGMKAPSLYSYFSGKPDILDALFADGYVAMDAALAQAEDALPAGTAPREAVVALVTAWLRFCQASPARYRLMFTSAVPGWSPSPESYAASQASYARMAEHLGPLGLTPGPRLDLWTAVTAGLAAQQMANDPAGDRWVRLIGPAIDMLLDHATRLPADPPAR